MNEIEINEIKERINAMSVEEQKIVARALPDCILWEELYKKYSVAQAKMALIRETLR